MRGRGVFERRSLFRRNCFLVDSEPKCFVDCPAEWSWQRVEMLTQSRVPLAGRCIRGEAASVLMAITEGGSRWKSGKGKSEGQNSYGFKFSRMMSRK